MPLLNQQSYSDMKLLNLSQLNISRSHAHPAGMLGTSMPTSLHDLTFNILILPAHPMGSGIFGSKTYFQYFLT